jgi:alanine-glyoxylate transaminase/serine-glyoxylate transaminase/serine-pyruvate transaminase
MAGEGRILYPRLNPSERTLLGPDLSNASPRARQGLIATLQGATDPEFLRVLTLARELLRDLWRTTNEATFLFSGSEETGMEAVLVNLVEPGDPVVVCSAGFFGERLAEAARQAGAEVHTVEAPWGRAIDPAAVEAALGATGAGLVLTAHGELSTGVLHPLGRIAEVARGCGALVAADLCATTAVIDVPVDEWGLDAVWSGSQKGLSGFPGLTLLSFSPRAVERIESRRKPVRSWLLDVAALRSYREPDRRHQTIAAPVLFALTEVLQLAYEQGMTYREERHWNRHEAVRRAVETLGLAVRGDPEHTLPCVVVVEVPAGVDPERLRDDLRAPYRIEIGPGLGPWAESTCRIGILSHSAQPGFFVQLVALMEILLEQQGHAIPEPGRAVRTLIETLDP